MGQASELPQPTSLVSILRRLPDRLLSRVVPPSSGERFPALDGLRGLAALVVVATHLPDTWKMPHFVIPAGAAVAVFFVLSGFLLTYPAFRSGRPRPLLDYYRRRFWRIAPAWTVALCVGGVLGYTMQRHYAVATVIKQALFMQSLTPNIQPLLPVGWSMAAEMQFYILLPLLLFGCLRSRWVMPLGLCVAFGLAVFAPWHPVTDHNWPVLALPFLVGMVVARFVASYPHIARAPFSWVGFGGLAIYAASADYIDLLVHNPWSFGVLPSLLRPLGPVVYLAAGCVIFGMTGTHRLSRAFSFRPLRLAGICGYSLFLLHQPILAALCYHAGGLVAYLVGPPLVLLVAALGYSFVERPAIERSRTEHRPSPVFSAVNIAAPESIAALR